MEIKDVKPQVDYHVNIDRINELPDELLTHVLSFLPTKESAATSVLCTRWKHLCTFVPDIDLSFDLPINPVSDADRLFLDFLNLGSRLVLLRKQASIRKFRLELWWADEKLRMEIVALITAALSCNLQELEFFVGEDFFDEGLIFPRGIFTCTSLVTLKLVTYFEQVGLDVPDSVFLPSVKELHLSVRLVDEDSLPRLLQGCPLLEELSISFHCEDTPNVRAVNFSGGSMKKLQVKVSGGNCVIVVESKRLESLDYEFQLQFQDQGDSKIVINTPNLKYLAYHARPDGVNFIQNLNSLIGAKLDFVYADEITSLQHLNRVQGVESLCLPMQFLKALHHSQDLLPTLKNLISLELQFHFWPDNIDYDLSMKTLLRLITNAPKLEALAFLVDAFYIIDTDELLEVFLIKQLKEINIRIGGSAQKEYKFMRCSKKWQIVSDEDDMPQSVSNFARYVIHGLRFLVDEEEAIEGSEMS